MNMKNRFNFIDLYAGIGGFRYALESIGGECKFTAEINEPALNTYSLNHEGKDKILPVVDMDVISSKDDDEIKKIMGSNIDVIAAGFPCQTFSIAGKRQGFNSDDTKGTQFFNVMRLTNVLKPKIVFLENVKNLRTHDNGNTYKVIVDTLDSSGYDIIFTKVMSPLNVGIPQNRERIFIVAKRRDINFESSFVFQDKKTNLNISSILDFEYEKKNPSHTLKLKDIEKQVIKNWEKFVLYWQENREDSERSIPTLDLDVITKNDIAKSKASSYFEIKDRTIDFYNKHKLWFDKWLTETDMGNIEKYSNRAFRKLEWNAGVDFEPKQTIVQIRVSGVRFKKPNFSPTLVAVVDNPIVFENEINEWRNMNFRELANLQSFPKSFKFNDRINIRDVYKQFGNSINVKLTKEIAKQFSDILN